MTVDECVMMLIIKIFQEILEKWMEKWFLMDYLWKKMERNGCRFLYQFKTNVETLHATSLQGFAERARFELAEEFPLRQFSKLVVSATHPPLRGFISEIGGKNTLFFDMPMVVRKKIVQSNK